MRIISYFIAPAVAVILASSGTERPAQKTGGHRVAEPALDSAVNEAPVDARPEWNEASFRSYEATTLSGVIGPVNGDVPDDAADNLFHINLDHAPSPEETAWLEYDLFGIADHDGVPRSIGHGVSTGGGSVEVSANWSHQRERIAIAQLQRGRNSIWFHAARVGNEPYMVRDVRIVLGTDQHDDGILVTNAHLRQRQGTVYVKGLLLGNTTGSSSVTANGKELMSRDGAFEGIVSVAPDAKELLIEASSSQGRLAWFRAELESELVEENGSVTTMPLTFRAEEMLEHDKGGVLTVQDAELDIPPAALERDERITAFALPASEIPPTGQDLINVCRSGSGYRFLPDGTTFLVPIGITLPFDTTRIPDGYGPEDIRTFYFDEDQRRWLAVPRDSLQPSDGRIRSRTTHFTDYINGIIQVPESPETMGYTPTNIKDYKAGDVSAGITPIAPPVASNTGAATTRFPLKLPQGRQGMQPELAIQYNSEGGNGWMGLGWNLSTPSITIETRWGVPRYDLDKETETYLLDGEMLTPVAHRTDWEERNTTGDKTFHTRVEGSFRRILRKENGPADYWWEITEKDGTRKYYGGDENGLVEDAVQRIGTGASSAIAKWMLHKVIDRNGNTITYTYDEINDAGTQGSPNMGRQIYPQRIRYTGTEGEGNGPYLVEFHLDDDTSRPDKQINCRLGFKEVTADLLGSVDVKYNGQQIRSYRFTYKEGAFRKTLLDSIVEYDANGERFYGHGFEYYDDVRPAGTLYAPYQDENWNAGDDSLSSGSSNPFVDESDKQASFLGASTTANSSFGASANVGPAGNPFSQSSTIGWSFGYSRSTSAGLTSLIDIDGDNLPDKFFRRNDSLLYRRNLGGTGSHAFSSILQLGSPPTGNFNLSKTRSTNHGPELHLGPAFVGMNRSMSKTSTFTYMLDRNGDGLIDINHNGKVYFNHRTDIGQVFTDTPASTENTIEPGGTIALSSVDQEEYDDLIESSPLIDVVRVWVAPYKGVVNIDAPIRLTPAWDLSYQNRDGVVARIQFKNEFSCSTDTIPANDTSWRLFDGCPMQNLAVDRGDRVYFRLHSIMDGTEDRVEWDPVVTYTHVDAPDIGNDIPSPSSPERMDANGKDIYSFRASTDFLLANEQGIIFQDPGTVAIDGTFFKPPTSDDIVVEITRWNTDGLLLETVRQTPYAWNETGTFQLYDEVDVGEGEYLRFMVQSNTNVEWQEVAWHPLVYYISNDNVPSNMLTDDQGNPTIQMEPVAGFRMYNEVRAENADPFYNDQLRICRPYVADATGTISLEAQVISSATEPGQPGGNITLAVKREHELVAKTVSIMGPDLYGPPAPQVFLQLTFNAISGETYYAEITVDNGQLAESLYINLDASSLDVPNHEDLENRYGINTIPDSADLAFGPLYRRWGQFGYNFTENGQNAGDLIDEEVLFVAEPEYDFDNLGSMDPENPDWDADLTFDSPLETVFMPMFVHADSGAWYGYDEYTYVRPGIMSTSRLGEDDVSFLDVTDDPNGAVTAPIKVTKDEVDGRSWGVSLFMGLGYTNSKGEGGSRVVIDAQDMNGDRYPDIVSEDMIQYTTPRGGYEAQPRPHTGGGHTGGSVNDGWSVGGGFVKPNFSNTANPSSGMVESATSFIHAMSKNDKNGEQATQTAKTTIGLNVNFSVDPSKSQDTTHVTWLDINGDGLSDKVFADGQVRLNTGYTFLSPEQWNYDHIRTGSSYDRGYGGGVSITNLSFAFGVSASGTSNGTVSGLLDINGDGLLDIVLTEGNGDEGTWKIGQVAFNTGNGFTSPVAWEVDNSIGRYDTGKAIGEAVNGSFSYGFNIPLPPLKFVFNVNGSTGRGFSRTETQFADINGDSYPDFLFSTDYEQLTVRSSTIRRTNLLEAVYSPFGAKWRVDYEVAGNTYDLPQSKWVMKSLAVWDGFMGDGPDSTYTTFAYADGQYDRRERETYGFGEVRTLEWDTETSETTLYRTTTQTYDVSGYYTKGLPLVKTVRDGAGSPFVENENVYQVKLLNGSNAPPNYNADNDDGSGFPALVRTVDRFHEGQPDPGITKTVTFDYDSIGNVTRYADLGFVDQDDSVVAVITYHDLDQLYIKSTPESIHVNVDGTERRRRSQTIDNANGNVTRIEQRIDDNATAGYDLGYYPNGNLQWIKRPANHKGDRMKYDYTYDPEVETYVTKVHDSYGYSSHSTYEYRFGQLESTTDMNGEVTEYVIDSKGRVSTVTGPYEIDTQPYTIKLDYHLRDSLPYSVVTHFDPEHPDGDGIKTVTFLDGLFRPVQVKKSAMIRESSGTDVAKYIASGRVEFDAFGRTVASWYPVDTLNLNDDFFDPEYDTEDPTTTTFDVLDRELVVTLPDGSTTETAYNVEASNGITALHKRVRDALNNIKDSYTDVREREIARVDHGPEGEIPTTFRYNAIGELQDVTDVGGNVTSYTYDQLGRKLTYDHPDGGLTEFTYDPAGNLLTKNTANLREMFPDGGPIKYSYDHQRVDTIHYPRNYMNQVVYVYGDSTETEFHRVGRVKVQLDGSGGQEFFYGPLGEVEKTIRTIVVSQTDIRTFVSEEKYDTWNRVQVMKYPDGDSVSYTYNPAGKLKQVSSVKDDFAYDIVKDIGYDKFEQRVYLKHGNDVETRYAYEPDRRRLSTLKVDQPNGTRFMDNVYTYDVVNNILSLENQRAVPNDGQGGPMNSTYTYDNLYRLTDAVGEYTGSARADGYSLHMVYDNLHNITRKTQTHSSTFPTATLSNYDSEYLYEGERPHTPSKVGYRTYTYDGNGNLADWDEDAPRMGNRQLAWDEENRLQAVTDEGYVSQYTYDAAGERVLKSHGGMQGVFINGAPVGLINHRDNYTIYVSPYLVHAEHGYTKHYFVEGQRVACRTGNGHFLTGPMPTPGITAGEVDFYSRFYAMQQAANQQAAQTGSTPGMPSMGNYNGQPEVSGVPYDMSTIGTYGAPDPAEGWPMPPVPPGAPGTPPTTPMPSVTNETVTAGYAFITDANTAEMNRYFFHPDHLGSASYITGTDGTARQHLEYMAFGETFVEEQNAADPLDYLFNGKELDRVTGLYYYGARYYDPVVSMWASVDPMAEKYAGWSPYNYTSLNPVNLIDPDGRDQKDPSEGWADAGRSEDGNNYQARFGKNYQDANQQGKVLSVEGSTGTAGTYASGTMFSGTMEHDNGAYKIEEGMNVFTGSMGSYTGGAKVNTDGSYSRSVGIDVSGSVIDGSIGVSSKDGRLGIQISGGFGIGATAIASVNTNNEGAKSFTLNVAGKYVLGGGLKLTVPLPDLSQLLYKGPARFTPRLLGK